VAVVLLNATAWGLLWYALNSSESGTNQVFGLGTAILAYSLGMRHAFDADHIAAIDNTTRKLVGEKKNAVSVGFFFSLGHSGVVVVMCVLAGLGAVVAGATPGGNSLGLAQTLAAGTLLCCLAIVNLLTLLTLVRAFRNQRVQATASLDQSSLPIASGLFYRLISRFSSRMDKPWKMLPVGALFGIGFDTATEIALLLLSSGGAHRGMPLTTILCLPLLFAAGMSLLDSLDGILMHYAYSWALIQPIRRIYYNLVVTAVSVVVAGLIGTVQLFSVLQSTGWPGAALFGWAADVDFNMLGYLMVGVFVVAWLVALLAWRLFRLGGPAAAPPG
jgi:high-affinity nickel-transport protein